MDDRERYQRPSTEEQASSPTRSTLDMRNSAERAEQTRLEDGRMPRSHEDPKMALFPAEELNHLRSRWSAIQSEFVDEPRRSVEEADGLVAMTIQRLAESFADARAKLESHWAVGGDVSTEDLRVALQRYRSFFDRLLAV
jgi:hypothetical protein